MADSEKSQTPWWVAIIIAMIGVVSTYIATSGAYKQKEVELQAALTAAETKRDELATELKKAELETDVKRQELEEQKRKATREERRAEEQEAEQHRLTYITHLNEHLVRETQLKESLKGKYYSVYISTDCAHSIYVAVSYSALDGVQVVDGWYELQPGQPKLLVQTTSSSFELYSSNEDAALEGTAPEHITLSRMTYIVDDDFQRGWYPLRDEKVVSFKYMPINANSYGPWSTTVSCSKH